MQCLLIPILAATLFAGAQAQELDSPDFEVRVERQNDHATLKVRTKEDQPFPAELEIYRMSILLPSEDKPGHLFLHLRPKGEVWIQVLGKQKGMFTFQTGGDLPNSIPHGTYLLIINGQSMQEITL